IYGGHRSDIDRLHMNERQSDGIAQLRCYRIHRSCRTRPSRDRHLPTLPLALDQRLLLENPVWQRTVVYFPAIAGKIDFDRGRTKLPPSQEPWPTAGRAHFSFKETVVKKTAIALALTLLAAGVYAQEEQIKVAGVGAH